MSDTRKTVILVDDEVTNLAIGKNALAGTYNVFTINSGMVLMNMLENVSPDLILLDLNMPGMNGFEVIKRLKANPKTAKIPVIFLTAMTDEAVELEGLSLGAIDFIHKPFSTPLLLKRLDVHLLVQDQTLELINFNDNLTQMVERKTHQVVELQNALLSTMAELVEYRDEITGGHIERTRDYIKALLDGMKVYGVYESEASGMNETYIMQSCQLHDVGKIAVSDSILFKPGKLTPEEFNDMKKHTTFGEKVILNIMKKTSESDFLEYARMFAAYHHEKWDGSGYPYGLKGEEIPLPGRMMAIADVYDALVTARPYKNAMSHEDALKIILDGCGTHFDPALINLIQKIHPIFRQIAFESVEKTDKLQRANDYIEV
ncbi:MAG: response regulator [Defluviitaleaceae bacterium]|nr:response regulator [Defluviitaleaceae bacterium]MCL2238986.1 response regulator [Defluviitaleaceae bacterium]